MVFVVAGAGGAGAECGVEVFHSFPQAILAEGTGPRYYRTDNILMSKHTAALEDPVSHFRPQAPWEFRRSASRATLQSYELSRLAHAANLRKEIAQLLDQWLEENASAMLARWLMEERERSVLSTEGAGTTEADAANGRPDAQSASDNVLADGIPLPGTRRHRH